jgi:hypothetical protein
MNIKRIKCATFTILGVLVVLLLAACGEATTEASETASPHPAESTVAALETENADLRTQVAVSDQVTEQAPTDTPTQASTEQPTSSPTATLSPTPGPTLAIPEDVLTATHETVQGYVFVYNPEEWIVEDSSDPTADFLVYTDIADCTINIAPETAPSELLQYYPRILGPQGWLVEGYEETTYYSHQDLKLELSLSEDDDCVLAQVDLLANVITEDEYNGAPARTPAVQPTQRPVPEGFACENALDTRLRVGDRVLIIAGTLWLRSEPRVDEETEIRFFQQYTPVEIIITGGPECVEESIFWEVSVSELAEGGETFTGWMAENGGEIYFLDIWYLGW